MADDDIMIEDDAISLEDTDNAVETDVEVSKIVPIILEKYRRAEDYRYQDEERWLKAYRNYRGLYGPDVQFTEAEKSRVFIKVTKTKTLAAYGQIVDVLFAAQKFPLSVDPTELPEGVVADVSFDPAEPEQLRESGLEEEVSPYGYPGDNRDIPAGATAKTLAESLGPLKNKFEGVDNVREGAGKTPTSITFSPAMVAAKMMQKKIHDQLEESGASKHLRSTAFEMALFGTGVMKGPFAVDKEYPSRNEDGEYSPSSFQLGYSLSTAKGPFMTPVPNNAISNAVLRKCLLALDSSNWSCIFFCIILAAIIAGLNVIDVGVLPTPSRTLSISLSLSLRGPILSSNVLAVAPAGKSLPSPAKP